ncbi:STAS domain-containing protein [Niveispirillum sp.]|uniref:STAS domain-containing protein n=1 Tax=Niveispirillum sp. TaxID=1917217 RepID=UPI001B539F0A|nr:STAS domain-containing protein [Niveispirillum sp.]MBP7338478.1 STAS domain-containing protein [Niveispirillum sp.]
MDYTVHTAADGLRVTLSGRMTLIDHEKFRNVVDAIEKAEGNVCIFDLTRLEFVDSSGLGMFLIARDVALPKKMEIELFGAQESVKRILQIAKFQTLFRVTP